MQKWCSHADRGGDLLNGEAADSGVETGVADMHRRDLQTHRPLSVLGSGNGATEPAAQQPSAQAPSNWVRSEVRNTGLRSPALLRVSPNDRRKVVNRFAQNS